MNMARTARESTFIGSLMYVKGRVAVNDGKRRCGWMLGTPALESARATE